MKQTLTTLTLALGLLFFTLGCGDNDDRVALPVEPRLEFDTVGRYDLSKYLFPDENQTNVYRNIKYINNNGKREYDSLDENETFFSLKYEILGDTIKEFDNNELDVTYSIKSDRVLETDAETNRTIDIVKFVDIGQYTVIHDIEIREDDKEKSLSLICKVNSYLDVKNDNDDILNINCIIEGNTTIVFEGSEGLTSTNGSINIYFAKNIGIVDSTKDVCTSISFNGILVDKKCKKTVTELVQITN